MPEEEFITITKRKSRSTEELSEFRIPGKKYNLREHEKAVSLGVSTSWLQKDRTSANPQIDFARYGRMIRYSAD